MLKKDLHIAVSLLSGQPEQIVREVLDAVTSTVLMALAGGTSVMLLGLGKLSVVHRGAKKSRHMVTGEPVIVAPRNAATLRASVAVREAINPTPSGV